LAAQFGAVVAGLWAGTSGGPLLPEQPAAASGGSTAGKYSTIPSAKRRFFGRVRMGIYKFLQMEPDIVKGDIEGEFVQGFFAKSIVKVKGGERIKGCEFAECLTKEKRTSRWLDFKAASDLLASAFRYDASDVPRDLPQVKVIRAYAKKVDKMQKAISEGDVAKVQQLYQGAKNDLANFCPMVELAPITSEDYTHEWDTLPEVWCQGQFCVS